MKCFVLLMAAGSSERFGEDKLWLNLQGRPVWRWSYDTFLAHPLIDGLGIVSSKGSIDRFQERAKEAEFVILGGKSRQESVSIGLKETDDSYDIVLTHDAARPFVSPELITKVIEATQKSGAACPGLTITDTVKSYAGSGIVTLDRDKLITVQSPQGALRKQLLEAYIHAQEGYTDDMALLESKKIQPTIVEGERTNIKITVPEDYTQIQGLLPSSEIRTGIGYDIHPFSKDPGRPLYLGGVHFPGSRGLQGHSDADVVLHAVVDALLGAAGLGDIGQIYPDTDMKWKNKSSLFFLKETGNTLRMHRWQIANIDMSVICETPKLMSRKEEICAVIAQNLRVDSSQVNIKATTNEKLGAIGRAEGICAFATATLCRFR